MRARTTTITIPAMRPLRLFFSCWSYSRCVERRRSERDEVEEVDDRRLGIGLAEAAAAAQFAKEGDAEQESHADRRQMAVRGADFVLVQAVGIDNGMGDRQQSRALVMIDDDHIQLRCLGGFQRLERLRLALQLEHHVRAAQAGDALRLFARHVRVPGQGLLVPLQLFRHLPQQQPAHRVGAGRLALEFLVQGGQAGLVLGLVQQGRAGDVLAYIDAVDAGVFA